jgi:carbon-monoxide dehydrogenase large subunit
MMEVRKTNTFVGSPVERVEDWRLLRGEGCYVDDLVRPGQWHAAVLRSPIAHGHLRGIDVGAALALPGIHAVITAADIGAIPTIPFRRPNPTVAPYAQPVIASRKVRYVGEPLALILADSRELAEDALPLIVVDIEPLPAVVDRNTSLGGEVLLFDGTPGNVASSFTAKSGDADAAFRDAPYTLRESFKLQRHTAMPMETRGLLAEWDAQSGRLTVSGAAKLPFFNRRAMASMMALDPQAVDYIEYDVGGGFGARGEFYPEDFLVAFAARKTGRPIKWVEDRREHFSAMAHSRELEAEVEIACDRDGTILGIRGSLFVDIGAYVRPNGMTPVRNAAQFLTGAYRVPNLHLEAHGLVSNKTPSGTYRGPGRYESCFVCERLLDIAAGELGIDRLDIRRRNLLTDAEMPCPLPSVRPDDGFADASRDSGDYRVTFERCVAESGWERKRALDGTLIDGRWHGMGLACFIEGGGSGPREHARMDVEADGSVSVRVGSSAVGQGIETVMAQIAADALELPLERVRVLHGSTSLLKEGFGSYGSRATVMGGSAIMVVAEQLLDRFRAAATKLLGAAAEDLRIANGEAHAADGRSVTLAQAAAAEPLSVEGHFASSKPTYTYGTAAAHVAVDPRTGQVEVVDYVVVDDVGRIVNPLTLHGQVAGAAVQGLGSVFSEHLPYSADGQPLVGSLADYLIPTSTEYKTVRCISLEQYPSPNNPLGAKGAGEGGIIPVGGAVANAVASALRSLGVQPRELPLTPQYLWELTRQAEHRA